MPQLSLVYNSQGREGTAGFGWSVDGFSCITLTDKTEYYHGTAAGAYVGMTDARYSMDGALLVTNDGALAASYPWRTVKNDILVRKTNEAFEVLYPDGRRAIYGESFWSDPMTSYPIKQITDVDGNKITFSYSYSGGQPFLEEVRYGFYNMDSEYNRIVLTYSYTSSYTPRYYAGMQMSVNRILSSIAVYGPESSEPLFTYSLVHQTSEGSVRLKEIHLENQLGGEVPPLVFKYGADDGSPSSQLICRTGIMNTYFPTSNPDSILYIRGKFTENSYSDGAILLPAHRMYGIVDRISGRDYVGSPYPENQTILLYRKFENDTMFPISLTAESGLCGIVAADVDGDGIDEVVKIHYGEKTSSGTYLIFKIYKAPSFGLYAERSVFLLGTVDDTYTEGPPFWRFKTGDFVGNGCTQLFAYATDLNGSETYNHYLIDVLQGSIVLSVHASSLPMWILGSDCLDIDKDGVTELCFFTNTGVKAYRYVLNGGFQQSRVFTGIPSAMLARGGKMTDMNSDGLMDFVVPPEESGYGPYQGDNPDSLGMIVFYDRGSDWTVYHNTGKEFVPTVYDYSIYLGEDFTFSDIDRNGTSDIIFKRTGTIAIVFLQNGGLNSISSHFIYTGSTAKILLGDEMHFDPLNCMALVDGPYIKWYALPDNHTHRQLLRTFTDSFGKCSEYDYADMADDEDDHSAILPDFSLPSGSRMIKYIYPLYLLTEDRLRLSESGAYLSDKHYLWYNSYLNTQGLGFMGFARSDASESSGSPYTYKIETRSPSLLGELVRTEIRMGNTLASTSDYTYDNHTTTYGKLQPRLIKTVSADLLTGLSDTTAVTYGAYDLPSQVTKTTCDGAQSVEVYTYQHSLSASRYILGRPTLTHKWHRNDRTQISAWNTIQKIRYDDKLHPVNIKEYVAEGNPADMTVFPTPMYVEKGGKVFTLVDDPEGSYLNLVSERRMTYDNAGRVISDRTAPYESTVFLGDYYIYDTVGRLARKTDKYGHTSVYGSYNALGQPGQITDWRSRTNTIAYDGWGNETQRTNADGTTLQTAFAWGGTGLFTKTVTASGKPTAVTHYDAAGREVRNSNQRFDGLWQHVDRQYDARGRLWKESFPFKGNAATLWTTMEYDVLGRPVRVSDPSGKESLWSYNGASTTTTKEGIPSTATVNASGQTIRVADAGGEILYTYNNAGNPTRITAPGGVETTFQYDDYGRRETIVDPSAGTQTESYSLNIFTGAMTVTSTNPKGTVITNTDSYGRTTSVSRVNEFTTTYTYNANNLLVSEVSTNGCSKQYTYDGYDRVTTLIETVPGGNVLGQAYTYGNDGNLASTAFFLGDDPETSEILPSEEYTYAYGHLKQIDSEGVTVWRLVGENALGQPTDVWTGNVMLRSYGFNAYGLPTWRLIEYDTDTISDVDYSFDARTGNLLSRADGVWNTTESFTYDALNRLVRIQDSEGGDRRMYFDTMGNIAAIDGVGDLSYGNANRPYQVTGLAVESGATPFQLRQQDITYTCFQRPSTLVEGGRTATFTYNGDDERVKMNVTDGTGSVLTRYYLGGRYELDVTLGNTREKLYLGGDAYSAPMVYVRDSNSDWVLYDIVRDYQGSITHLVDDSDGTIVAEYSYDPWGRMRDPQTLAIYTPGSSTMPELLLGRGYTAHEHLDWFGLINMNARLYDPALGRFLSPDPYVQAPDFSQNFNRYSYCLNNPLKYTDPTGEVFGLDDFLLAAVIGGAINWLFNGAELSWKGLGYFAGGALIGGLSAGAGAWVASSFQACGVFAGAGIGAVTGGLTGGVTNVAQNGLNNLLNGQNFFSGWGSSFASGALVGGIAGAVSGGIAGGKQALDSGKNVWWGNKVKHGRDQWSWFNWEKPHTVISFEGIPNVGSKAVNDCFPTTLAEVESFFGGERTYADFSKIVNYVQDDGTLISLKNYKIIMHQLFEIDNEMGAAILSNSNLIQQYSSKGNLLSVFITGLDKGISHSDVIRKILYYERKIKVVLRIKTVNLDSFFNKGLVFSIGGIL